MRPNPSRPRPTSSLLPLAATLAAGGLVACLSALGPRLRAGEPAAAPAAPAAPETAVSAPIDPAKPPKLPLTAEELAAFQQKLPTLAAAMKENGEQFKVINTLARSGFEASELARTRAAAQRMAKLGQYVGEQLAKGKEEKFLTLNEQWWLTARKLEVAAQSGDAARADELTRELKTRCLNCHEVYNQ